MKVKNTTRGILCIAVPSEQNKSVDPVGDLLKSIHLSPDASPEEVRRIELQLKIAELKGERALQQMHIDAEKAAEETVDLLPEYQGEQQQHFVNVVEDAIWRRIEKIPVVAAKIATGDLQVVDYPATGAPF